MPNRTKFRFGTFVRFTFLLYTMGKWGTTFFVHYIALIYKQKWKIFHKIVFGQNERCTQIAFSGLQNVEIEHNEILINYRTDDSLKFGLGTFVLLHIWSNHHGKIRHCRIHTSHHDNKVEHWNGFLYCSLH
jgi:hypothetical protein